MKLAIAGAAGRMGRVLTRIIHETPGAEVAGGIEPLGSPFIGADLGVACPTGVDHGGRNREMDQSHSCSQHQGGMSGAWPRTAYQKRCINRIKGPQVELNSHNP